jgi:hypothetical protein
MCDATEGSTCACKKSGTCEPNNECRPMGRAEYFQAVLDRGGIFPQPPEQPASKPAVEKSAAAPVVKVEQPNPPAPVLPKGTGKPMTSFGEYLNAVLLNGGSFPRPLAQDEDITAEDPS